MTKSAFNLALKLLVLHVELQNMKHGVLHDALVEVSEPSNSFLLDRAQKGGLVFVHYIPRYQGGGAGWNPPSPHNLY